MMTSLPFTLDEYLRRQSRFLEELHDDSLVLIPTNPLAIRSNDVRYPYRASSYMLYLCGWADPEAVFMAHHNGDTWVTTLFVQPRDTKIEIWEGVRVGTEGASTEWPVDTSYSIAELDKEICEIIGDNTEVFAILGLNHELDLILEGKNISDPRSIIDKHRVIKSNREIEVMQESASIAIAAHIHAIKSAFPGIGEWQIQAIIEGHFTHSKSQWSYPSIVGGGDNATILHYKSNDCVIDDGALVLVDAGCEVGGYASDITRTWPVNGKFSEPQKEIYELVLNAELAGIEACQVGSVWLSMHRATSVVLAQGLIDLGILDCSVEEAIGNDMEFNGPYRNFFMHGTGHFLGLDVHDVGGGRQGDEDEGPILQPGMVVTVEPGLYFGSWRTDVKIPEKYSGIGIRIEDNVLITEDGPVVLTSTCPKGIDEIEELVGSDR
jgi:Xaa-Pro aminopeptidase